MVDGYAYLEELLAQVRADLADAGPRWLSMQLRRWLAVLTGQVELRILGESRERLRLADAEVRERLSLPDGAIFPPRR